MIRNPIFPGFNPDPCFCRKNGDYYIAVSTFEWMPGIPVYHSRDLKHWELLTHILTDEEKVDLKRLPSAKGIWAPCLTYCEEEDLFYVVYGVMNSMNARYFDVDNYLITARDIRGPWSEPVYLHSAGFDASLFHDVDGRKWLVSLEWETRAGYNHCVTMARSRNIWGPYEGDPENPILTSAPGNPYERDDPDHLKPQYFNPNSVLQKSGHGSYVETPEGEVYLAHLTSRPFVPELRCTLGRETAIQKMEWTKEGWLRLAGGGNLAKLEVQESSLPSCPMPEIPSFDDFDGKELGNWYYAPRQMPGSFADVTARPGYVRLRGGESRTSLHKVSILARKLTSVYARVTTKMEFTPEVYQHSAGLIFYYDNMNYINLRKYYSETLGQSALSVIQLENGEKTEYVDSRIPVEEGPVYLRLYIEGRKTWFAWSMDGEQYQNIGPAFDTTKFSDEYCRYGEFTGTMVGITCADRLFHRKCADFDFLEYLADEDQEIPGGTDR